MSIRKPLRKIDKRLSDAAVHFMTENKALLAALEIAHKHIDPASISPSEYQTVCAALAKAKETP